MLGELEMTKHSSFKFWLDGKSLRWWKIVPCGEITVAEGSTILMVANTAT